MGLLDQRPGRLLRILFRGPIVLYRVGVGRLLGHRFLYLVHTGRKTGLYRETVLEVVRYDPDRPEAVVVAAWGERADWFRNIAAAPPAELRIGSQRWPRPRHRVLSAKQTTQLLDGYRRHHPWAWKRLAPLMGFPSDLTDPAWRDTVGTIRAVAFTPRQGSPGPPPAATAARDL